jgi:hypothetical protein
LFLIALFPSVLSSCQFSATAMPRPAQVETTSAEVVTGPQRECRSASESGCVPAETEAILERAQSRIEECRGPHAGKVTLRARVIDGKLALRASPDTTLDPRDRQCIYDTLQEANTVQNNTLWSQAPQIPPSNFTSLVMIEWE